MITINEVSQLGDQELLATLEFAGKLIHKRIPESFIGKDFDFIEANFPRLKLLINPARVLFAEVKRRGLIFDDDEECLSQTKN